MQKFRRTAFDARAGIYRVAAIIDVPPPAPAPGGTYLVGPAPIDAWAGKSGNVSQWTGATWLFAAPVDGEWAISETQLFIRDGGEWIDVVEAGRQHDEARHNG